MRLHAIELRAFRSFENETINVNTDRAIIGGVNASGKSSCREAVRFALTGSVKDADDNDLPGELLAPDFLGRPLAAAAVVVEGIGCVEREWTPGSYRLGVSSFTGTPTVQQQALYDKLSTTEAMLQAVIDSRNFLRLHHAKGKALIMGLLDVRVKVEDQDYTLDDLDAAYKDAFEQRKLAKLKQKGLAIPPLVPKPDTKMTLIQIEDKLKERRQELDEALKEVGGVTATRKSLEQQRDRLDGSWIGERKDPVYIAGLREQIPALEKELLVAQMTPAEKVVDERPPVDFLRNRAAALAQHQPRGGCVLDPTVPCETARAQFTRAAKVIDGEIAAAPLLAGGKALPSPNQTGDLRRQLDEFQRILAAHDAAQAKYERLMAESTENDAKLAALPDTAEAEEAVTLLRAKVAKGDSLLRACQEYDKAFLAHQKALGQQQHLQAEVDALEARCTLLGPTGARVAALAEKLGAFEEQVNVVTSAFGWTLKLQVEPWQVLANDRPVQSYSWSEQYRIGIALQLAIAKLSGLDFAIVDELDLLDAANRKLLFQMLYTSEVGQLLILATREPEVALPTQKDGSPLPETLCYRLGIQNRRSVILEQVPE